MNKRFVTWILILAALTGIGWGWRTYAQLREYRQIAHTLFMNQFENGVTGAYNQVRAAKRLFPENPAAAGLALTQVSLWLWLLQDGASGMSFGSGANPWGDMAVTGPYRSEADSLAAQLVQSGKSADAEARLDDLLHDLESLYNLVAADGNWSWLQQASPDELNGRFVAWRSQARIKTYFERSR